MTLRIYLDFNRNTQQVKIIWRVVDSQDFVQEFGAVHPSNRYHQLFNRDFASATLAFNYALYIMTIASDVYRTRDDVRKTEIIAVENDTPYKPIEFDNPFNIGWFFKWGGAI